MSTLYGTDPAYSGEVSVPGPPEVVENESAIGGNWPPMAKLGEETESRLVMWLNHEIWKARTERSALVDDWKRWQTDYWAKPAQKVKNFPFQRAANIVIPLTAIAVEAIHARMVNTFFSVRPFWSIRARAKDWINVARPFEDFLQSEAENAEALNVYGFASHSLMELVKLGTCVGKSGYEIIRKKSLRPTLDGLGEPRYVDVRNGATLDYVPLANFLIRIHENDPQKATWCGEEHTFTWTQLKRMAADGRMMPEAIESLRGQETLTSESGGGNDYEQHIDSLTKEQTMWSEEFTVVEVWASFDIDGDGYDEEIVLDYHEDSNTILAVRYNWYEDLHRPYRNCVYIPVEGRFYGIGVGKQNEQFQEEVTTIRRQRLDNATLANMRMIALKKNSGYGPGEPVFPGKIWFLDDPSRDIQPVQMSEVYNSSIINEESVTRYSEKRTGVNEVILGMPQSGTPGTATGDLARIAEGNQKFDLALKNVRQFFSLLGKDVVANYQQFGTQDRHWLIENEKGDLIEQVLSMPTSMVRFGAIIDITVTDSMINRQVDQQQWMMLFSLITNYYDRVLQLSQILQDPELFSQVAQRALIASDEAMKSLLETFTVPDTDRFLLSTEDQNANAPRGPGSDLPGGAGGPEGVGPEAGMEGLSEAPPEDGGGLGFDPSLLNF